MREYTHISEKRIYLDYAATTPLMPCVSARMIEVMDGGELGNPSSVHTEGRKARRHIEDARQTLRSFLPFPPSCHVIWTSGGTEANHMLFRGLKHRVATVIGSAIEHPSVGFFLSPERMILVDHDGTVCLQSLEDLLKRNPFPALVSVQWVNNETGVIQPIEDIGRCVRRYGGLLHVDAVQGLGKVPFSSFETVDALTLSAHKIGGPPGVGALVVRAEVDLHPLLAGGNQENRLRAGTENIGGIVGFEAALQAMASCPIDVWHTWRKTWEEQLGANAPCRVVYGAQSARAPHIISLGMPGVDQQFQLMHFDLKGFAVSAGSACTSGKVGPSHVLKAMGLSDKEARQALRISFGWNTQPSDLEAFRVAWLDLYRSKATI